MNPCFAGEENQVQGSGYHSPWRDYWTSILPHQFDNVEGFDVLDLTMHWKTQNSLTDFHTAPSGVLVQLLFGQKMLK